MMQLTLQINMSLNYVHKYSYNKQKCIDQRSNTLLSIKRIHLNTQESNNNQWKPYIKCKQLNSYDLQSCLTCNSYNKTIFQLYSQIADSACLDINKILKSHHQIITKMNRFGRVLGLNNILPKPVINQHIEKLEFDFRVRKHNKKANLNRNLQEPNVNTLKVAIRNALTFTIQEQFLIFDQHYLYFIKTFYLILSITISQSLGWA
ncbi:unnamed protein product [Paramecium octaurelia]|uniref:Uncharacterized protein n=1 Tax=Paramecium octaurelia TaxID=43137 RepID=A0A8S1TF93_PAROT|nr:unnamed protein product [Paramecium octaurelia]